MTDRAQEIVDATLVYSLRPRSGDRSLVIASALQWLLDNCSCVDETSHSIDAGKVEDIIKELTKDYPDRWPNQHTTEGLRVHCH